MSTFGTLPNGDFTDQVTHHPGARYWIPTMDEWLKAAQYDPAKPDLNGWWLFPISRDTAPIYGRPGEGEANAGFLPGGEGLRIPLGAHPDVRSPWGLLDAAGGATDWTEGIIFRNGRRYRTFDGSYAMMGPSGAVSQDLIYGLGGDGPGDATGRKSMRLAAVVPNAASTSVGLVYFLTVCFGGVSAEGLSMIGLFNVLGIAPVRIGVSRCRSSD